MSKRILDYERLGGGEPDEDEDVGGPERFRKKKEEMQILLDDPRFVVVSKPSGLPSVPERFRPEATTVVDRTEELLRRRDPDAPRPIVVHRLDKDTSGAILMAKDEEAARDLSAQFEEREVGKTYVALTTGAPQPPSGESTFMVTEDPKRPGAMTVVPAGAKVPKGMRTPKECSSTYETLEVFRGISFVRVRPLTGRTHQVRITLQHLGTPCAIDDLYGSDAPLLLSAWKRDYRVGKWTNEKPLIDRLTLHAESISFRRPGAAKDDPAGRVTVEAPLPRDFAATLKQLRRWAAPGTL